MFFSPSAPYRDQQSQGIAAGSTTTTQFTGSGSANVKGLYSQVVASSPFDSAGFWFYQSSYSTDANHGFLSDLALGAAASEVNFLTNIWHPADCGVNLFVPLFIPAGQRISGRTQADTASVLMKVNNIILMGMSAGHNFTCCSECIFDTADTANSRGTTLAAAGSINTKTGWTQLVASTSKQCKYLIVQAALTSNNTAGTEHFFDIGIGAAASELVLIPDLVVSTQDFGTNRGALTCGFWVDIPASSRISARHQANTTADAMQLNLIGLA